MEPIEKALDMKAGKAFKLVISIEPEGGEPAPGATMAEPELSPAVQEEIENTTDRAPEVEQPEENPDAMMAEMDELMTKDMLPHDRKTLEEHGPKSLGGRAQKHALDRMKARQ